MEMGRTSASWLGQPDRKWRGYISIIGLVGSCAPRMSNQFRIVGAAHLPEQGNRDQL